MGVASYTTPHADGATAVEAMVRTAALRFPDIAVTKFEVQPYRNGPAVRAIATFAGASDRDTVVGLSEDLTDLIAAGVPGGWTYADRMECDHVAKGFRLAIGFDAGAAAR